jgi:hypothetical protein
MKANVLKIALITCAMTAAPLHADTNEVQFPENYRSTFVRYTSVDKPNKKDSKKTKMRYFYVNPQSLVAAKVGQPLPNGTVLVMEDHAIERDGAGNPALDSNGRFIPTDKITNVFIQEKQAGWGAEYPADTRNGEWEYAWFNAGGSRKAGKTMEKCFACHQGVAAADYNFTFTPFVVAIK